MQSLDAATAIDRSGRPTPIWGARQPLPKTARYRLVFLRRHVVPGWNGARGSPAPSLARARWAQNDLDSTRRPGDSQHARRRCGLRSAAQAEALDQRAGALHVDLGDIFEQTAPTPDQQQQPAPRVVVVLVLLEVFGQVSDPLGQQRDLGLRGSGVGCMQAIGAQDFFFLLGVKRHEISPSIGPRSWI